MPHATCPSPRATGHELRATGSSAFPTGIGLYRSPRRSSTVSSASRRIACTTLG